MLRRLSKLIAFRLMLAFHRQVETELIGIHLVIETRPASINDGAELIGPPEGYSTEFDDVIVGQGTPSSSTLFPLRFSRTSQTLGDSGSG